MPVNYWLVPFDCIVLQCLKRLYYYIMGYISVGNVNTHKIDKEREFYHPLYLLFTLVIVVFPVYLSIDPNYFHFLEGPQGTSYSILSIFSNRISSSYTCVCVCI